MTDSPTGLATFMLVHPGFADWTFGTGENRDQNPIIAGSQMSDKITVSVAVTVFPEEVDRGGHFAAWEHPELFAAEMRAAIKPLR